MKLKEKNNCFLSIESANFEDAINLTGYGRFHYKILAVSALCIVCVGFQNGLSGYVFPAAQCELNLTSYQIGFLNVIFMIGGALSSFLWGTLADIVGRRRILLTAHLINAFVTIILIVLKPVSALQLCRFVNGFLIGAPGSIIFTYLAEFQPKKYRSSVICYSGLFFTSTWLLLPLISWAVLSLDVSFNYHFFKFSSWRLFFIFVASTEALVGFLFYCLPESPKFLAAKGQTYEAIEILRNIYKNNGGITEFPIKKLIDDVENEKKNSVQGRFARISSLIRQQFKILFKGALGTASLLTCSIMFSNMFGVFGLGIWLPELFIRFQKFQNLHPNETISVSQLSKLVEVKNTTCNFSLDVSVIESTVAMGVTSLITNFLSGFFISGLQLKTIPTITMFIGGLSALSIYWLRSPLQNLIIASIFQAAMVTANMTIGNVAVELFPTSVAALAISLVMFSGRIGAILSNLFFGYFIDKKCEIPIFIVAVNVLLGSGLCLFIPQGKAKTEEKNRENIEINTISTTMI